MDLVYGIHPNGELVGSPGNPNPPSVGQWPFSSRGTVWSDAKHRWDWRICYAVTVEQYARIAEFIRGQMAATPDFHLLSSNCTYWIARAAATGGITLPSLKATRPPFAYFIPNLADPEVLATSLKQIGNGKTFNGGLVSANSQNVPPDGGADPPATTLDTCSASGLARSAFAQPVELASALHARATVTSQSTIRVGRGKRLTVSLAQRSAALDTRNALIEINFGDGTWAWQSTKVSHTYAKAGHYTVRVAVVEPGEVARVTIPVDVGVNGQARVVNVTLPSPRHGSPVVNGGPVDPPAETLVPAATYRLTITRSGTGSGTVGDNSNQIACGVTCSADLAANTVVTLAAGADNGSVFGGWNGGCSGNQVSCQVTMTSDMTVNAAFNKKGPTCTAGANVFQDVSTLTITCSAGLGYVQISARAMDSALTGSAPLGWTSTQVGNTATFRTPWPAPPGSQLTFSMRWRADIPGPARGLSDISARAGHDKDTAVAVTFN